ncbi:PsiF family protein [Dokdonella immobilis]|uniref:PsiF repeat-containing protein n=1 Tax=Dokdonella immobilis TaxID=578942 RepID=A0A1I4V741_9GAMM|nr:PsiF family protein [Dokdonella immobilis]SFM96981.1 psiF repeat-containing protein [Dokdonella immobilis]
MQIRTTLLATVAMALLFGASAAGAGGKASVNSQKAADCNSQAAGMTGSEREAFMQACLGGTAPSKAAAPNAQASCRDQANAQGLRGEERRAFMDRCRNSGGN